MKRFYQVLFLSSLCIGSAHSANLTFDDVPGGSIHGSFGDMPTYQGFNFSATLDWVDVVAWPFGAHSGSFAILNNQGGVGTITRSDSSDFTFGGLWAKQWRTPAQSGGVAKVFGSVKGFNNGIEIWSIATALNGSYQLIGGQAQPIDELRLGLGNFFLADNLTVTAVTAVPEADTWALLLVGLGLVGAATRRRQRAKA